MKNKFVKVLLLLVACMTVVATASAKSDPLTLVADTHVQGSRGVVVADKNAKGVANYIIQLTDAPIASYRGGIVGYAATNAATTGARFLQNSDATAAYQGYLQGTQAALASDMSNALGRQVEVKLAVQHAFNGIVVAMSPAEAEVVAGLHGVVKVYRETMEYPTTDAGPAWIGAPGIWDGTTTGGLPGTKGEGVVVAILDTGINHDHPSFADVGGDGYDHTNPLGSGNYISGSYCATNPSFCNDKLIGAWDMVLDPADPTSPEDSDDHGSHTASTVAGNQVDAFFYAPTTTISHTISGVAPHANIIAYDVCVDGCPGTALLNAVNQTVIDSASLPNGIVAINYSISGGEDPFNDPVEMAFLGAVDAGIFVSASAGNAGPTPTTVAHRSPWVMTVAASTHNRSFANNLTNMTSAGSPLADMAGAGITTGYGPAAIVYAGNYPNPNDPGGDAALCGQPYPAGTFTGQIVICDRGIYGRVAKGANVLAGGAGGYVLANDAANGESLIADPHELPGVHISFANGVTLKAWVAGNASPMAEISGATIDLSASNGDIMAGFSSRGPNTTFDVTKPDITAPGVDIWAAFATFDPSDPAEFGVISGTSMSSPHDAGAAALMAAVHPSWSPMQIKSAMMLTAWNTNMYKEDKVTPADPFDLGNGRVNLNQAANAALVMDETTTNFMDSDPANGGNIGALNIASFNEAQCLLVCTWTRVLESTYATDTSWAASGMADGGVVLTVDPANFTITAGGTQMITVTADVSAAVTGDWLFGEVVLMPVVPVAQNAPAAPVATVPAPAAELYNANEAAVSVAAPLSNYQAPLVTLYDNGPLATCSGCGTGGADESMLQSASLAMNTLGFGHQVSAGNRVADDFTVTDAAGWDVDAITFYAYQTNAPVNPSPITGIDLKIWDGAPNDPASTVVWSTTGAAAVASTTWSNIYRTTETTVGATNRGIFVSTLNVGTTLPAGTYWLDWSTDGSAASGPWIPPITIIGTGNTGNGMQSIGGVWAAAVDGGADAFPQGFPFMIEGSVVAPAGPTVVCSSPNLPITDNSPAGVSDMLSITDTGSILDMNVVITATHTWVGDLTFTLTHVDSGTSVTVIDRPGYTGTGFGCSGNDIAATLDDEAATPVETQCGGGVPTIAGTFSPNNALSAFDSEDLMGDWTMQAFDAAAGDTGDFVSWCVVAEAAPVVSNTPAAHFSVAVIPSAGVVPTEVNIDTRRNAGSQVVSGLETIEVTDLNIGIHGVAAADMYDFELAEDPTNGDAYDDLSQVWWMTFTVPANSYNFIAQLMDTTAPDLDLFIGMDTNMDGMPELGEETCRSTSGTSAEYCDAMMPAAGDWWVIIQNWQGSGAATDSVTLAVATVGNSDNGMLMITGPASVPLLDPYALTFWWDLPTATAGDVYYGAFSIGSDAANPGNIAENVPVMINRWSDDVVKTSDVSTAEMGDTVTYTIVVDSNITPADMTYWITDTLPAGLELVAGSATASAGTVSESSNGIMWTGVQQTPVGAEGTYAMTTTATDAGCVMPLATGAAYVNLADYGVTPNPAISGDTFDFFTGGTYQLYEGHYTQLHFTDDGFLFFEDSTPGTSPWTNEPIPSAGDPNSLMAAFWRDFEIDYDAATNKGVSIANLTSGGIPVAKVIEYDDARDFDDIGTYDFEVYFLFAPDNTPGEYEIIYAYDNLNGTLGTGTIGVENSTGTAGTQAAYDDIAVTADSAICFDYTPAVIAPVTITYQATVVGGDCTNMAYHNTSNPGSMEAMSSNTVTCNTGYTIYLPFVAKQP